MPSTDKRHLEEHEEEAGLSAPRKDARGQRKPDTKAWLRAALRHKHKLNGVPYIDERLQLTDSEFKEMLEATLAHSPEIPLEIMPPAPPRPAKVEPKELPQSDSDKAAPAAQREE